MGKNIDIKKKEESLNEGQKIAIEKAMLIIDDVTHDNIIDDFFLISGKGGTGKTYITEIIYNKLLEKGNRNIISHVAPTWNAVNEILISSTDDNYAVSTLASFLGTKLGAPDENLIETFILLDEWDITKKIEFGNPPEVYIADYIILDEASMLGGDGDEPKIQYRNNTKEIRTTDTWRALIYRLKDRKKRGMGRPKKILFVGDYAQIPPIGTEEDHDSFIIERLMSIEKSHHILTQNMRTNKNDLHELHEIYRRSIDIARKSIKEGKNSDHVVSSVPIVFSHRKDSENIFYHRNTEESIEIYADLYKKDPQNVRNVVFINYNRYNRPETQSLIKSIRKSIFGEEYRDEIMPGDLLILSGQMLSTFKIDGVEIEVIWQNETRFYVDAISEELEKNITVKLEFSNKKYTIPFVGRELTLITDYGKKRVRFTNFVPNIGEIERVFPASAYDKEERGFRLKSGKIIPYGVYKEMLRVGLPSFNFGYVVNSHKVQGSSYEYTIVDEGNILKCPGRAKQKLNLMYTAISRPKQKLYIFHKSNPQQDKIV